MKYTEIEFELKNDDVVIKLTPNRVIATGNMTIKELNFQQEKENIKKSLLEKITHNNETSNTVVRSSKHRKRA